MILTHNNTTTKDLYDYEWEQYEINFIKQINLELSRDVYWKDIALFAFLDRHPMCDIQLKCIEELYKGIDSIDRNNSNDDVYEALGEDFKTVVC